MLGPDRRKSEEKTVHVDVKMIRLDWLFAKQGYSRNKRNSNDFLQILDKLDDVHNETLNATTLVDALLIPVK